VPRAITRREMLARAAVAGTVTAGAGYLALAPEHWPLSLRDGTGLRGMPVARPFELPDFRVPERAGLPALGLGRGGAVQVRLRKALDAIGGIERFVAPGDVVLVKPNVAFDRSPNLGATTNPEVLEWLVRLLLVDARAGAVRVADNPIESPADCFAKSGIGRASERAGAQVFLPDSNAFEELHTPGAKLIERWPFFRRPFKGVNKVIGIAPVKDHNLCQASLGIKNWYGLLGGRRNQFHQDIHGIIADLSMMIRPTLTILDGSHVLMANGPTGGDPSDVKDAEVIVAATDPVAMDAYAFEHLLERPGRLPEYLYLAEARGSGRIGYRGRIEEVS
jgi:uncharacterized protein (DUF362 family)